MRSTSDGGLRKDIFSPSCFLSEKCVVIYQIRVSSDGIFLPVPNTHNTHSVSLDVWSFVIRQEANCNNLIPLRVRLQHCQVLMEPNSSSKDKHFEKQSSKTAGSACLVGYPGCPSSLLAGWLWLPEKSQRHLAPDKYNYSREHAQTSHRSCCRELFYSIVYVAKGGEREDRS